jgi:hypothetical protein
VVRAWYLPAFDRPRARLRDHRSDYGDGEYKEEIQALPRDPKHRVDATA